MALDQVIARQVEKELKSLPGINRFAREWRWKDGARVGRAVSFGLPGMMFQPGGRAFAADHEVWALGPDRLVRHVFVWVGGELHEALMAALGSLPVSAGSEAPHEITVAGQCYPIRLDPAARLLDLGESVRAKRAHDSFALCEALASVLERYCQPHVPRDLNWFWRNMALWGCQAQKIYPFYRRWLSHLSEEILDLSQSTLDPSVATYNYFQAPNRILATARRQAAAVLPILSRQVVKEPQGMLAQIIDTRQPLFSTVGHLYSLRPADVKWLASLRPGALKDLWRQLDMEFLGWIMQHFPVADRPRSIDHWNLLLTFRGWSQQQLGSSPPLLAALFTARILPEIAHQGYTLAGKGAADLGMEWLNQLLIEQGPDTPFWLNAFSEDDAADFFGYRLVEEQLNQMLAYCHWQLRRARLDGQAQAACLRWGANRLYREAAAWCGRLPPEVGQAIRHGANVTTEGQMVAPLPALLPATVPALSRLVKPLLTYQDLEQEHKLMRSCVDSYYRRCVAGDYYLFSIRQADGGPSSTFALLVRRIAPDRVAYEVAEHRGRANAPPCPYDTVVLLHWLVRLGHLLGAQPTLIWKGHATLMLRRSG